MDTTDTPANSAIAPLAAQDRGPEWDRAAPPLEPQSQRVAHPVTSRHGSKDTALTKGEPVPSRQKEKPSPPAPTRPPSPLKFRSQQSKHSGLPHPRAGCPRRHLEARASTASLLTGSQLESTPARASERLCPPQCRPQALSRERGTDVPQLAQQFHSLTLPGPPTGTKAQSPHRDPALRHSDFSKHEGNS